MKFTIKTETLKKGLEVVNHATATITTTPILENILMKVNFGNIVLTSNNLEMAIEYLIDEDIDIAQEWALCIPSKLFSSYIGLVNEDEIMIEKLDDNSIKVSSESGKMTIKWIDASEFPLIPSIKEETSLTLPGKVVQQSIEKTLFSTAEWNIRPTLAGILVKLSWNEAIFASTDSFRLTEYKAKLDTAVTKDFSWIIPSKTSSQIKSLLQNDSAVKIVSGDNQIAFIFGKTRVFSRLLNWQFPDYSNFFPKSHSTRAEINKVDLTRALKKINLVSKENNYSIKMSLSSESGILLETSETQIGEWNTTLPGNVEGEDNIVGINSTYFLEVLWVIESTHVSISFENPLAPIMILPLADPEKKRDNSDFKHIIMPLKI